MWQFNLISVFHLEKAMAPHSSTLLPGKSHGRRSLVGCSPWGRGVGHDWVTSLSLFTLHWRRKWQPTHVLDWRIPGTVEPGGLLSMGSHRVGHDWSDLAAAQKWLKSRSTWLTLVHSSSSSPPLIYHSEKDHKPAFPLKTQVPWAYLIPEQDFLTFLKRDRLEGKASQFSRISFFAPLSC